MNGGSGMRMCGRTKKITKVHMFSTELRAGTHWVTNFVATTQNTTKETSQVNRATTLVFIQFSRLTPPMTGLTAKTRMAQDAKKTTTTIDLLGLLNRSKISCPASAWFGSAIAHSG